MLRASHLPRSLWLAITNFAPWLHPHRHPPRRAGAQRRYERLRDRDADARRARAGAKYSYEYVPYPVLQQRSRPSPHSTRPRASAPAPSPAPVPVPVQPYHPNPYPYARHKPAHSASYYPHYAAPPRIPRRPPPARPRAAPRADAGFVYFARGDARTGWLSAWARAPFAERLALPGRAARVYRFESVG
ncbi:hypothetical protein HETIRDRAFT_103770, partial [Heterobasidion irregulare TC 32-1]